jgi:hypothetical protein
VTTAAVMELDVAKKTTKPPESPEPPEPYQPPTQTVRVAVELVEMASVICAHEKAVGGRKRLKMTDLFDSILRPVLTARHQAVLDRIASDYKKK